MVNTNNVSEWEKTMTSMFHMKKKILVNFGTADAQYIIQNIAKNCIIHVCFPLLSQARKYLSGLYPLQGFTVTVLLHDLKKKVCTIKCTVCKCNAYYASLIPSPKQLNK